MDNGIGTIIELIGTDGDGKTYNLCSFPEELCLIDIDNKAQKTVSAFYPDKLITVLPCFVMHNKSDKVKGVLRGNMDVDKTVDLLHSQVSHCLDNMENFEVVALDSVSDLRRLFAEHWLLHDKKNRPVIGDNPSAWSEINESVKEKVIFPIINTARSLNKIVILTSKMTAKRTLLEGDDGKMHSVKTDQKEADVAEWIGYRMDIKITLQRDPNNHIWLYWNRAPKAGLPVKEDITGKSLYDCMCARGVL